MEKRKQPDRSWKLAVRFADAEACDAVVTFKDRERHETACGFKQVRCPLTNEAEANDRCPAVCSQTQLEEHMQTCEYRRVPCFHARSGCQWEGSLKLEEMHRKNCDFRPQPCKNGCEPWSGCRTLPHTLKNALSGRRSAGLRTLRTRT